MDNISDGVNINWNLNSSSRSGCRSFSCSAKLEVFPLPSPKNRLTSFAYCLLGLNYHSLVTSSMTAKYFHSQLRFSYQWVGAELLQQFRRNCSSVRLAELSPSSSSAYNNTLECSHLRILQVLFQCINCLCHITVGSQTKKGRKKLNDRDVGIR